MAETKSRKYTWAQYGVLIVLCLCNLISSAIYSIQAPFYPPEAEKKNVTPTEYGIVFGIHSLVTFLTFPFAPIVTHKFGSFCTFHTGIYIAAISVILFGFLNKIDNHAMFLILSICLRIMEAIGTSLAVIANYSFGLNMFPDSVATVSAVLEAMFSFGQAAGPQVGGLFYELGGFTLPFLVLGGTFAVFTICTLSTLPRDTNSTSPTSGFGFFTLLKILIVKLYAFNIMSGAIAVGFLSATLEPHIRQFDLTPIQIGAMFLIYGAVFAICSTPWGYLCDNMSSPHYIPIIGSLLIFLSFMMNGPVPFLGIHMSVPLTIASLVLFGIGLGAVYVSGFALMVRGAKNSNKFQENLALYVSSLWLSAISFGNFIGPIIGGALFQHLGFSYGTVFIDGLFFINVCALLFERTFKSSTNDKDSTKNLTDEELKASNTPLLTKFDKNSQVYNSM